MLEHNANSKVSLDVRLMFEHKSKPLWSRSTNLKFLTFYSCDKSDITGNPVDTDTVILNLTVRT